MKDESKLTEKELAVYNLIKSGKITQLGISRHERWLGCHKHEEHLPICKEESTLRQIRDLIRDLRLKGAPILADDEGYWLGTKDEAIEVLARMERTIKARNKSSFETYKALKNTFGISNDFFESQGSLFPSDN